MTRKKYCFKHKHTESTKDSLSRDYTYFRVETNKYVLRFLEVKKTFWSEDFEDFPETLNTGRLKLISKVSEASLVADSYDFFDVPVRKIRASHDRNREIWNFENRLRGEFCWDHNDAVIAPLHLMPAGTHVFYGSRTWGDDEYY